LAVDRKTISRGVKFQKKHYFKSNLTDIFRTKKEFKGGALALFIIYYMEGETAPRERKIRRGIVMLSSFQVLLGAVIIGMSFTAFASTSSPKIRGSSPYWAGFMVRFSL
jgi:Na+-transporting NADH:ubiquinone oxidoreductase subunit NqrB